MKKNNIKVAVCEEKFGEFAKKMAEGFGKIQRNFIRQMLLGITKSESVLLTEIARNSINGVMVKKSVERFSRQLRKFDSEKFEKNRIDLTVEILPENKMYLVDDSEVVKPCAKKMELLEYVRDGSDGGKLKPGYHLSEIVAVDKNRQPVSVFSKLYSVAETRFESANTITQQAISKVVKTVGNGLFVFDRGFDDVKLFEFLEKKKQKYIIRATSKRDVLCKNGVFNIEEVALSFKGKFSFQIKFQSGLKENLKASYTPIFLPKMPTTPLNMVVVYGFSKEESKPFYILTNLKIKDKDDCIKVVRAYLYRWKIEEYFKFKKQAYDFEKMRVQSLRALKNLNLFLTTVITFLAILGNTPIRKDLLILARPCYPKVKFEYYRLLAGLCILARAIKLKLEKSPPKSDRHIPKQRDFFYFLRYQKRYLTV